MNEIIPTKIERIQQEIQDLEAAIDLCKNRPTYKVDQGAYPALTAVKQLLADAQTEEESAQRLSMLEEQVETRKVELNRLTQVAANSQQAIELLKAQQSEVFARYQKLQTEATQLIQLMFGYGQEISRIEANLKERSKDGVLFAARTSAVDRVLSIELTDEGRVLLGVKSSGVLSAQNDGFGQFFAIADYSHLTKQEQAA